MEKKPVKEVLENFRGMKLEELHTQKDKLSEDLSILNFKRRSGQLDDLATYRRMKKAYARLQGVITEKERLGK